MSNSQKFGTLALIDPTILTITGGVVTTVWGAHIIAAETGTTDDLDTITLGQSTLAYSIYTFRPFLFLQADAGDVITLKHGTGNIDLPSDTDVTLNDDTWIMLFYNGTNWQIVSAVAL